MLIEIISFCNLSLVYDLQMWFCSQSSFSGFKGLKIFEFLDVSSSFTQSQTIKGIPSYYVVILQKDKSN